MRIWLLRFRDLVLMLAFSVEKAELAKSISPAFLLCSADGSYEMYIWSDRFGHLRQTKASDASKGNSWRINRGVRLMVWLLAYLPISCHSSAWLLSRPSPLRGELLIITCCYIMLLEFCFILLFQILISFWRKSSCNLMSFIMTFSYTP